MGMINASTPMPPKRRHGVEAHDGGNKKAK